MIARFGLMHVVATNLCVWIRTLVLEYIKEITIYHRDILNATSVDAAEFSPFAGKKRNHFELVSHTKTAAKVLAPSDAWVNIGAPCIEQDN